MDSAYRMVKMTFWEIIDANWSVDEQNALARWCKAFEDLRR